MPGKLLQWLGVFFVIGCLGASVFALTVVKDRIKVVVQADEADAGPDPTALLRDDLQVVAQKLGELQNALGGNFERLGGALEERAEARHADVQALARDVQSLQRDLAALRQQVDAGRVAMEQWSVHVQGNASSQSVAVVAPPVVAEPKPEPVPEPKSEPEQKAEPVPAPAPPKKGFLSFSVPASTFRFDAAQDYVLAADLCRVGFDAKSTLHDFSGVTGKVTGRFTANLADPAGAWQGEVVCDAGTLLTGVEGRDTNMWEHLDTKNHPQIKFAITKFVPAAEGIDAAKQTVRGEITGTMTIRGKSREVRMPITAEVDASKRLVVKGQTPLKLSDYEVPVPSQLGVINMQDEVVVWIALRARVQATGGKK